MGPVLATLRERYGPRKAGEVDLRSPAERLEEVAAAIKQAETQDDLETLTKRWVEHVALTRIVHGDVSAALVSSEFNLGTTYLRQRLVSQAMVHFTKAKEDNVAMGADAAARALMPRILEGLGICETRHGNLVKAQARLDEACALNRQVHGDDHPSGASILVAKSELHGARGEFQEALDTLGEAFVLKEAEVGSDHVQIGKLYQAMARVRERQTKHVKRLLAEVKPTLEAALDVKNEFEKERNEQGARGEQIDESEEVQFEQLLKDIKDMKEKHTKLRELLQTCVNEAVDYSSRSHQTLDKCLGQDHPVTLSAATYLDKMLDAQMDAE
mmetsp:Transcript_13713/g.32461  ORF Transcript_13713/g.32461 Transcript_13713/m.32461 type:complete len:328 (-) Transcript_13713:546-1529(-)